MFPLYKVHARLCSSFKLHCFLPCMNQTEKQKVHFINTIQPQYVKIQISLLAVNSACSQIAIIYMIANNVEEAYTNEEAQVL